MRGVLAAIWAVIVFLVVLAVINFCASLKFPPGSTSGNIMRDGTVKLPVRRPMGAHQPHNQTLQWTGPASSVLEIESRSARCRPLNAGPLSGPRNACGVS
jgi:hypothetical protein